MYFVNVVGTFSCCPRQSTPPGVARACGALRVSGREKARSSRVAGLRLRRAGARAGGRDLKAGDTRFAQFSTRPESRVRATMSCERAHAMFPHALIVVCAVCSAFALTTAGAAARSSAGSAPSETTEGAIQFS